MYALTIAIAALIIEAIMWSSAKLENAKLHNKVAEVRNQIYREDQLQKLDSHLQKTLPIIETIENKLSSTTSQSDVMEQLSRLARSHTVRMRSQSITAMLSDDNFTSIKSIELRVSGSYTDIRKMLVSISAISAWLEIAEIRIERLNESDVGAQVKLLLIMEQAQ